MSCVKKTEMGYNRHQNHAEQDQVGPPQDAFDGIMPSFRPILQMKFRWHNMNDVQPTDFPREADVVIKKIFSEQWTLPTPNLIISVIGTELFSSKTELLQRRAFTQDLISILMTTNAWLITDGKYSSITKEVCKAIQQIRFANTSMTSSRVPCIAIVNKYQDNADSEGHTGSSAATTLQMETDNEVEMQVSGEHSRGAQRRERIWLDYNHSHCLYLRGMDTEEKLGQFRAAIEDSASTHNFHCPVIQILAGGDRYSMHTVFQTIERGWPVLTLIAETKKRKPDSSAHKIYAEFEKLYGLTSNQLLRDRRVYKNLRKQFPSDQAWSPKEEVPNDNDDYDELDRIRSKKAYFLLLFYLFKSSEHTLSETIFHSLLNWTQLEADEQTQHLKKLKIAIAWNCTEKTFPIDETIASLEKSHLHEALIHAIFHNKVYYVEYLIERGVPIQCDPSCIEKHGFWQITPDTPLPPNQTIAERITSNVLYAWCIDHNASEVNYVHPTKAAKFEAIRNWLRWATFMNRPDMVKCLCSYTQNPIVATLLVSRIYRKAAHQTVDQNEQEDYLKKEQEFDHHAAKMIDQCFDLDSTFAVDTLQRSSSLYAQHTPLILAELNKSRMFLSTKTMWKYLDNRWFGDINEKGHSKLFIGFTIFVSCLFVFLIPLPPVDNILSSIEYRMNSSKHSWYRKIFDRYRRFYRGRVAVRFFYNIILYILFLGLFSYLLLVGYFPLNDNGGTRNGYKYILIPVNEIIVHILTWCFIVEETEEWRRHWRSKSKIGSWRLFWSYYSENKWNILDLVTYTTYLIGFITRFFVIEDVFIASKIFMCINLFLWYVRILHLFLASEKLGPKLLMIFNTMVDLVFFICFIVIFLVAYSVNSYALLTTNNQVFWVPTADGSSSRSYTIVKGEHNSTSLWRWGILRDVIEWGMWKIYGEVEILRYNQADSSIISATSDAYGNVAFILTIVFVCVANVLLLSVLVALFNVTVQKVKEDAVRLWPYHRFVLITEYERKSMLPSPFNLIQYVIGFFKDCINDRERNHNVSALQSGTTSILVAGVPLALESLKEYDRMCRERHIARSYWKSILGETNKSEQEAASQSDDSRPGRRAGLSTPSRPVPTNQLSVATGSRRSSTGVSHNDVSLSVPQSIIDKHRRDSQRPPLELIQSIGDIERPVDSSEDH